MPVRGADVVAENIVIFGGGFKKHVNKVMGMIRTRLDSQVTENISLRDHSPKDLAALGHPYASRHGNRGIAIHDPYWQVHVQSGKLLSSKKSGVDEADISDSGKMTASAWCGVDEHIAPHALDVFWGTSKMIPRDFLGGSLEQIRGEAYKTINDNLRGLAQSFEAR